MSGGLARTFTAVSDLRREYPQVVLLDAGGFAADRDRLSGYFTSVTMDVMEKTGYDGINVNGNDVLYTGDNRRDLPFVSTNIVYREGEDHVKRPYRIVEKGGIKIGIVGISPGPTGAVVDGNTRYKAETPAEALEGILPALRKKSDMVVLLSSYSYDATRIVMARVDGIDIAVAKTRQSTVSGEDGPDDRILEFLKYCASLDYAVLTVDTENRITAVERKRVKLDAGVRPDPEIDSLTGGEEMKKRIKSYRESSREKALKEHEELTDLSPAEYVEMLLEKQKKESTGE